MHLKSRFSFTLAALFALFGLRQIEAQAAAPQEHGKIAGRIIDARTGQGLSDVGVLAAGTTYGTMSSLDGRFILRSVPAGTVTLTVRRIGYIPKTVTGLVLHPGSGIEQDISLEPATISLTTQVVSAASERGTVDEALNRQRNAATIVNSITSEQITRSTDSDAAQAVRRVSGVTVQDGKYVFVRGLGERYTTALLNGARIPSPEPEKKVVPLDLFPAGLLQSITTSKTFSPDQAGDFSGAQVNIRTREFPVRSVFTYSSTVGYNTLATGKSLAVAPVIGGEWLARAAGSRELPPAVQLAGNFGGMTQAQTNNAVGSFRNAWTPVVASAKPNAAMGVSGGGQSSLFGQAFGYIASASYSNTQEVKSNEQRALAVPTGNGSTREFNRFNGASSSRSTLLGGLFNISTMLGSRTRLEINNTLNRTADNEAKQLSGTLDEFGFPAWRSSLGYVERTLRSNQLRLESSINDRHQIDLQFSSSGVTRLEPDRSEVEYVREQNPFSGELYPFALFSYNSEGARRTYGDLREENISSALDYRLSLGEPSRERVLKTGLAFRYTDRDAVNTSYSIVGYGLNRAAREQTPEQIFDGRHTGGSASVFNVILNSTGGSYWANDRIGAAYAMLESPVGRRLRLIGGLRVEGAELRVNSISTSGEEIFADIINADFLPALIANISLGQDQTLRLSASQTLSRPEYRELSPITYRDVIEQRDIFGNPALKRALIQNYDARWEWYPGAGEILSVGLFAKRFRNPVERVDVATSGASQLSFINADAAINHGIEIDVRKRLDIVPALSAVTLFTNATVMRSEIDISSDRLSALTNRKRAMVGQAPFVVNAGLSYSGARSTHATVLYNVVGRRITAAGVTPLPDTYESARHGLDLSLQTKLFAGVTMKLDGKNLLDAPFQVQQGTVIRERYRSGRVIALGLRWQR